MPCDLLCHVLFFILPILCAALAEKREISELQKSHIESFLPALRFPLYQHDRTADFLESWINGAMEPEELLDVSAWFGWQCTVVVASLSTFWTPVCSPLLFWMLFFFWGAWLPLALDQRHQMQRRWFPMRLIFNPTLCSYLVQNRFAPACTRVKPFWCARLFLKSLTLGWSEHQGRKKWWSTSATSGSG